MPTLQRQFIISSRQRTSFPSAWKRLLAGSLYVDFIDIVDNTGQKIWHGLKRSKVLVPAAEDSIKLQIRRLLLLQKDGIWQEHLYENIEGIGFYHLPNDQLVRGKRKYTSWMTVRRGGRQIEIPLLYTRFQVDQACKFLAKRKIPHQFLLNRRRVTGFKDRGWELPERRRFHILP